MSTEMNRPAAADPRVARGLYDPSMDRDSCGVGFVVNLYGRRSHTLVEKGLEILVNLTHRGGCGCDPLTGDGAGILTQMPYDFFAAVAPDSKIDLPAPGDYSAGLVFLPREKSERKHCKARFEQVIAEEGQRFLGWRDVPQVTSELGPVAAKVEPDMQQIFVGRGEGTPADMFEWKMYVIRKRMEVEIRASELTQKSFFYVPSLSSKTIVYKGLMLPEGVSKFYPDLQDERFTSALALVHQRFSTNTFPTWDLAQPFRFLAHNGEINTLRGNVNWMHARERLFASEKYGADLKKILPICTPDASDTAIFDNALELLLLTGRSLAQAMTMLIPEPWDNHESMSDEKKAYYEYQACLMEPWDGPASMVFTDGTCIGATLDRNGLRPSRYWVTKYDHVIMASEAGVLQIPPEDVVKKGRLQPGRMFLVDTTQGRIVADDEIKRELAARHPYREWLKKHQIRLNDLPAGPVVRLTAHGEPSAAGTNGHSNGSTNGAAHEDALSELQRAFGYTLEDLRIILAPMAKDGLEPLGSMGTDTPLAVLSSRPQVLFNYFKQLFAQVTNPPLDAIREEIVTSMVTTLGTEGNLLDETEDQCSLLRLDQPILTDADFARIKALNQPHFKTVVLSMLYSRSAHGDGLKVRLEELRKEASKAIEDGATILILSDRGVTADLVPIPSLLATSDVHHHLVREETRTRVGLVVETGEAREVHHFCLLAGYGAGAVNPYLALASIKQMLSEGFFPEGTTFEKLEKMYIKACNKGLLKVMSKMGISTLQSYRGAQIFEAIGLDKEVIDEYFTRTSSRLGGVSLEIIAREAEMRHDHAFPKVQVPEMLDLDVGGQYQWRRKGEYHMLNPDVVSKLQQAVQINSTEEFKKYCDLIDRQEQHLCTLRGLLRFKKGNPIPLDQVESAKEIMKRFATGAMSYGSISQEAHETLAVAMNRIGGKSNTGEGGEDPARYMPDDNGDSRRSAIKQVASGRFGVTAEYLWNADELQIKMAQGAKPGEGGQLPGHKVSKEIARVRHSTPLVGLISPPPHHDIYSIEDLAQLIHDLKNANRHARVSVKLVAEVGVGTVAAGVAKAKSDVVLIAGHDGGTGASPITSIKHAGAPWELGLAETHQVLVANDLRSRVVVQTDGMIRTSRDVAIATLLGAEEWGIATGALVATGCIMMRKCHLNTCPVGIATQDPVLRKKYAGKPEYVVNFFFMLAEGLREIMASLGFRTINEMVGRSDLLEARDDIQHWKAKGIDLSKLLYKPDMPGHGTYCTQRQDHGIERSLDMTKLLETCKPALERGEAVEADFEIRNVNRTACTVLSSEITNRYGAAGLPEDTIKLNFRGTAGQSIMAFATHGITTRVEGDVNDYCGKGLSGGKIAVYPPRESTFVAEENIICGNVALYGATAGQLFVRGLAGERFCVRNSGAEAVVEGVGDHGCEYMTGGHVVIIGPTGRNFAAGMSGGIAFVLDEDGNFTKKVNREMVELEALTEAKDLATVQRLLKRHVEYTGSTRGQYVLDNWERLQAKIVKVMPTDYRRALAEMAKEKAELAKEAAAVDGAMVKAETAAVAAS